MQLANSSEMKLLTNYMYCIGFWLCNNTKFIVILVFHNSRNFCNSITLLCAAKKALVKQTAFINTLCTEVSSKLFYSLTIVLFSTNYLDKASKLLFIFVRVRRGYAPFPTRGNKLFLVVYEACTVVFQLLNTCKT